MSMCLIICMIIYMLVYAWVSECVVMCVSVCVSCECVFGHVYVICMYVYIMYMSVHVCMYRGVCSCEFMGWVTCCSVRTHLVRFRPVAGD